jgi:hypothetical protein
VRVETFVIRVFVASDQGEVPFAGVVEHIGAGRTQTFHGGADLVDVVLHELRIDNRDGVSRRSAEEER